MNTWIELTELRERFDALWDEDYALPDPVGHPWRQALKDREARDRTFDGLLRYAHRVQADDLPRRGFDEEQRLFEEMGVDPAAVRLDDKPSTPRSASPAEPQAKSRILYIECKAESLRGPARIGRVTYSRSGRTLHYGGLSFRSLNGAGFKSNYYCVETGEEYWISGPHRDGADRLHGERIPIEIDEDVREEYWTQVRGMPEAVGRARA